MNTSFKLLQTLLVHHPAPMNEELHPGQVIAMDHSKGKHLFCTSGCLWVTLEHGTGDLILEPNQSFDIPENGRVVISALDDGSLRIA